MDAKKPIPPQNDPPSVAPERRDLLELIASWEPLDEEDKMPEVPDLPADPVDL